jgi:hypothetical protein
VFPALKRFVGVTLIRGIIKGTPWAIQKYMTSANDLEEFLILFSGSLTYLFSLFTILGNK